VDAASFITRFYNGNPASGAVQIGTDKHITSLVTGAAQVVSVAFSNSAGEYSIYVTADAATQIMETREDNNTAFLSILIDGDDDEDGLSNTYEKDITDTDPALDKTVTSLKAVLLELSASTSISSESTTTNTLFSPDV